MRFQAASTILATILSLVIIPACSDYNSIEADADGPALTLDMATPSQSVRVRVCYDGSTAEDLEVYIDANLASDADAAATMSLEDGSNAGSVTADESRRIDLDLGDFGSFDDACETGVVVTFMADDAAGGAANIEWNVHATATDSFGDDILNDTLTIEFEAL